MEIIINQRIELLTVIQTLCGYWENLSQKFYGESLYQCKYKDNIKEYFEKYKRHETLELYNHLSDYISDISVFLKVILCHCEPPELNLIANYDENIDHVDNFINSLKKFYTDTNFQYFFESNKNEYDKIRNDFLNTAKILTKSKFIFEYLGIDDKNYKIILSPLVFGNFGFKIKTFETQTLGYTIISVYDCKDGNYLFGTEESIKRLLRHEISHTVINDLTEKYLNQSIIKNMNIPDVFVKQFYNSIETIINEYIIRAITYSLEEENKASVLDYEIKNGFTEIKDIGNYIKENCENKGKLLKDENYIKVIKFVIERIYHLTE
jgi:hypothetical protein